MSEAAASRASSKPAPPAIAASGGLKMNALVCLVLAVLAAAATFGIYRLAVPIYDVPAHLLRMFPSDEDARLREIHKQWATAIHAAFGMGVLGLLAGALWAGGEAIARGRNPIVQAIQGALIAGVLGALGGVAGAYAYVGARNLEAMPEMASTLLTHAVMFGLLGIGLGLAAALASGNRSLVAASINVGLFAGVVAAVLFHLGGSFLLPHLPADSVIPDSSNGVFGCVDTKGQLGVAVWLGVFAICVGLLLPFGLRRQPKHLKTT